MWLISHALKSSLLSCFLQSEGMGLGGQQGLLFQQDAVLCPWVCLRMRCPPVHWALPCGKEASLTRSIILWQCAAAQGSAGAWATARIHWVQSRGNSVAGVPQWWEGRVGACAWVSKEDCLCLWALGRGGGTKPSILMGLLHPSALFTRSQ